MLRAFAGVAICAAALVAAPGAAQVALSYSFEEAAWTNGAGQATDDGPFGLHGTPAGNAATASVTETCRYGVFDGVDEYVETADHAALDIASELTVAAWIYMRTTPSELHTIVSKDTNYEYHVDSQRRLYWWWNDSGGATRSLTAATQLGLNQWHHVAVTYRSGEQRMYVDGVLQGAAGAYAGTLATNNLPLYVGTDWNYLSRAFDGYIDEVRVISSALTPAEIEALRVDTQPCAPARFTITHNAFGIHCLAETVTVNVIDSVTGTPLVSYNGTVELDTQSGYGTWALAAGTGAFSDGAAGDGVATYDWPLGQAQATFALSYPEGPPAIDVDVAQVGNASVRDDDSEGPLVFSPNGFTVTAAELANPPGAVAPFAGPETAGTSFALHLAAFGQTASDPVCGIIEEYTGAKSLRFWSQYVDPDTGTINATIDGVPAAADEGSASVQAVEFSLGKAAVSAKYKDVGSIRIAVKDDTTANADLPAGITGATANFVVRPHSFTLHDIVTAGGAPNPQAVDAAGAVFVAAGAPFRATVTARDAEGSPTPNYGREHDPETVRLDTQLVSPIGGASPAVDAASGFGAFSGGEATGSDFTWAEVGVVRLVPGVGDEHYLTAGDVVGTPSEPVGRFVPSHFAIALNSPLFAAACSSFTYQGQTFGYATAPVITATAVAANGSLTSNYTGDFFKLSNATVGGRTYSSTAGVSFDLSGLPLAADDPVVGQTADGVGTVTFSSGSGLAFAKGAPQAAFAAGVQLAVHVEDADGVAALANPVTFGSPSGIQFVGGDEIRYGRIRIGTAVGSELVALPVPMRAEYYRDDTVGFVANTADTCTTDVVLSFPPASFTGGLNAGDTCVLDDGAPGRSGLGCAAAAAPEVRYREPPVAGDFNLRLAAPGAGNQGSVVVTADVPPWLQFDWDASTAPLDDPAGQATFGIFGGERRLIYTREIY